MRTMAESPCPIWQKYLLTVPEAASYFGIGSRKIRDILDAETSGYLSVWNGNKQLVKRKHFEEYLDECCRIN